MLLKNSPFVFIPSAVPWSTLLNISSEYKLESIGDSIHLWRAPFLICMSAEIRDFYLCFNQYSFAIILISLLSIGSFKKFHKFSEIYVVEGFWEVGETYIYIWCVADDLLNFVPFVYWVSDVCQHFCFKCIWCN